jgi:aminobenzoyl-glutamate utilization protein B
MEERMKDVARGAALMTRTQVEFEMENGLYEILVNEAGAKALHKNMELVGPITYTEQEKAFAEKIMKEYGAEAQGIAGGIKPLEATKADPEGGSTDVGDVSYIVPEITLNATTAPYKSPWHSWVVVACGGMSIGHKGMLFAAKSLGTTMVDLFENESLRKEMRAEFEKEKDRKFGKQCSPTGRRLYRKEIE